MKITPAKKWALTQIFYQGVLNEIGTHFHNLNIKYMPIKGAYLICSGLAEKFKDRHISDIDILVQEKDMQKSSDYFASLENTEMKVYYKYNYRQTETVFNYSKGDIKICVEIHSQLNFPERFVLPTPELFARSITANDVMHLPSPEDGLLVFLCHLQSHISFEFRESNMEEINIIASQNGFNWKTFWSRCPTTGIEAFIYFIIKLYQKKYPAIIAPSHRYLYSDLLVGIFNEKLYKNMPHWSRRLFLELPFVRKPIWLLFNKLSHNQVQ